MAEPRKCVASTSLTASEYDGLIQLSKADGLTISDMIRELLSEAILRRHIGSARASVAI